MTVPETQAPASRLVYVMVGRVYKVGRVVSQDDSAYTVELQDLRGTVRQFEAARGVHPHSGLPLVIEPNSLPQLTA